MLPQSIRTTLEQHLKDVRRLHEQDVTAGRLLEVYLPYALDRPYKSAAAKVVLRLPGSETPNCSAAV